MSNKIKSSGIDRSMLFKDGVILRTQGLLRFAAAKTAINNESKVPKKVPKNASKWHQK